MRRAHGFIVMVDVSNPAWEQDVRDICNRLSYENRLEATKVLVANKIDLKDRAFTVVQLSELATELGFADYFEVSMQKRINSQKPIETLVQKVYYLLKKSHLERASMLEEINSTQSAKTEVNPVNINRLISISKMTF